MVVGTAEPTLRISPEVLQQHDVAFFVIALMVQNESAIG
jgi:hypothetical protein